MKVITKKKRSKSAPKKKPEKHTAEQEEVQKQSTLKRLIFGEEKPDLSELEAGATTILDILSPTVVDTKSREYIVVDGVYHAYLYVTGYGYSTTVGSCWLSPLVEAGEGVSLSFIFQRQSKDKILAKIAQTTMVNRSRMRDVGDTRQDFEELDSAISSGLYLKDAINREGEDFYYMHTLIEVTAPDPETLEQRITAVEKLCVSVDMIARRCDYKNEQAFLSMLPLLSLDADVERKSRRNALTSGVAAAFPFASYELSDRNGVFLGLNMYNRSPVFLDIYDDYKYTNGNIWIGGSSGAGKTFTLQCIGGRLRQQGKRVIFIVPKKGHEFRPLCEMLGGLYLRLSPSSKDCPNIMAIRRKSLDVYSGLRGLTARDDSVLADKISRLIIWYSLHKKELNEEDRNHLDSSLVECYRRYGITFDNASITDENGNFREMPILPDWYDVLSENPETKHLAVVLARYVKGSASAMGQRNDIDLHNKYIVLDTSGMPDDLLLPGIFWATDIANDLIMDAGTDLSALIADELWSLVGANSNPIAAGFVQEMVKTIRGLGGAAITSTQGMQDLFGLDGGKYGKGMAAKKKVIGLDPVPHIRAVNFIAPRGLDLTHPGYIIMDGVYYTYLYVRKGGFPQTVRGGWMSSLINAGEGVDVDLHLRREIRGKTIDKVAQRIRLNRTKLRELQDTSTDYEELAGSIQAGYYIKQGLSSYNEDLFYMSVFVTISAATYEELLWRKQQMSDLMKSMDIQVSDCLFQQEAALHSTMPFLTMDASLERKSKRNVLTSGAASSYMFTSFELSDDNGILLGLNRHNNSLCIVDPFNTKVNKNANFTICGTSGAGKTYTMQVMALRMRMRGIQCFILAPLKGHEFKRACHKVGGTYIKLAPGSTACINVMEIRPTLTPEMELIDELDYSDIDSMLAKKIQQLMIFFSLLIPDMSNEEEQMLDEALIKTYAQFGITHDNNSLYTDAGRSAMKPMPILGDLYDNLKENPMTQRLAAIVSRFVTGSAQSFNRQTNVNLDNKYVVLDISELKGKLLPVGMMIALDYVWDQVKADRTKRKMVFIDEIWKLIGGSANKQAAEFCLEIFKIIRGYGGGALAATQDLSDFFGLEDGRYGRAILNNSKTKIILNLEPDEAEYVKDVLKLTRTEIRSITQFERGEALISSNSNKVPVIIKASKVEQQMITTDRAELEAMLNEMKAMANSADKIAIPPDEQPPDDPPSDSGA